MPNSEKYCTIEEVREEIINSLKKVIRTEFCPHCKELQSMWLIYHIDMETKSFPPRITESMRCPGCLRLFENKLEEVNQKTISKEDLGFAHKTPIKDTLKTNSKVKKEDSTTPEC